MIVAHICPFPTILFLSVLALLLLKLLKLVNPLSCCWWGGRLLLWVRLCPPSNRGESMWGLSRVTERKRKERAQLFWAAQCRPQNFFPFLFQTWGWWVVGEGVPCPPAAVETGCSVPAVESRSHRWSGEGTVQAGPRLCALLQFLKEMFSWSMVLCSSTTSKCCFQPYF